jgi:hypothetical protein
MAMADNVLFLDDARSAAAERAPEPEVAEAAEVVAALSALIDAGLVVVRDTSDGPARYAAADGGGEVA